MPGEDGIPGVAGKDGMHPTFGVVDRDGCQVCPQGPPGVPGPPGPVGFQVTQL